MVVNNPEMQSHDLRRLAMHPNGFAGRAFGKVMEATNAAGYAMAMDLLAIAPGARVLEIGFGTGRLIELLLTAGAGEVLGVDPSPTMLAVARRRRPICAAADNVDLRLGSDADLDWITAPLDAVVAINSFQFWAQPEATLDDLRERMMPGGRLVLILRDHGTGGPGWLPNPLSRAAGEVEAAVSLIACTGFETRAERRGPLVAIVSNKPA